MLPGWWWCDKFNGAPSWLLFYFLSQHQWWHGMLDKSHSFDYVLSAPAPVLHFTIKKKKVEITSQFPRGCADPCPGSLTNWQNHVRVAVYLGGTWFITSNSEGSPLSKSYKVQERAQPGLSSCFWTAKWLWSAFFFLLWTFPGAHEVTAPKALPACGISRFLAPELQRCLPCSWVSLWGFLYLTTTGQSGALLLTPRSWCQSWGLPKRQFWLTQILGTGSSKDMICLVLVRPSETLKYYPHVSKRVCMTVCMAV